MKMTAVLKEVGAFAGYMAYGYLLGAIALIGIGAVIVAAALLTKAW